MDGHTVKRSINGNEKALPEKTEELIRRIRDHAFHLYQTKQMLCTEAVLSAINQGLDGGLTDTQAIAMAAPFSAAMGESGCLCGALSGAVMASGLLLGKEHRHGHRSAMRQSARRLHDEFKVANGATCCRALTRKVRHDRKAHFRQCAQLTAQATEMAARLVLERRPDLVAKHTDDTFMQKRRSSIFGLIRRLVQ